MHKRTSEMVTFLRPTIMKAELDQHVLVLIILLLVYGASYAAYCAYSKRQDIETRRFKLMKDSETYQFAHTFATEMSYHAGLMFTISTPFWSMVVDMLIQEMQI